MVNQLDVFRNKWCITFIQWLRRYNNNENLDIFKNYGAGLFVLRNNIVISVYDPKFIKKIYDMYPTIMKKYFACYHRKLIIYMKSLNMLSNYIISNNKRRLIRITDNYKFNLTNINFIYNFQLEISDNLNDFNYKFIKREQLKHENIELFTWLSPTCGLYKDTNEILVSDENQQPTYKIFSMYDENLEREMRNSYYYIYKYNNCTPPGLDYIYTGMKSLKLRSLIVEAMYEYKMFNQSGILKNIIFLEWFKNIINEAIAKCIYSVDKTIYSINYEYNPHIWTIY